MKSSVPISLVAATTPVLVLSCVLLLTSCGQESSVEKEEGKAGVEEVADGGDTVAEIALEPANNSGMVGTATFKQISDGVEVGLDLAGLPDPGVMYLSHIHPGNCGEERGGHNDGHEEAGEEHSGHDVHAEADQDNDGASAEDDHSDEIDYPLTPVDSDTEGRESSTTLLEDVTVEELLSGEPKYINVHAAGSEDDLPPDLACSSLNQ